jgi:uncharacterized phage protein (TIGR01671 family)
MREIEFRGKHSKASGWYSGNLILHKFKDCTKAVIDLFCQPASVEVIIKTVGQYTGLKDKNGVKIFEGDIMSSSKTINKYSILEVVEWQEEYARLMLRQIGCKALSDITTANKHNEVIGNIHDNPELLDETLSS